MMKTTYWLSFAKEKEFGGAIVVDVEPEEVELEITGGSDTEKMFVAAVRKTIEMGINPGPGYSVQGKRLPPDEIPAEFKNRLLGEAEVRRFV